MNPALEGFALQASLIAALGAQNIFVIESALRKRRPYLVSMVSSVCDALLIAIGVFGVGQVLARAPVARIALGAIGVAFLALYGWRKIREAGAQAPRPATGASAGSAAWQPVVLAALGFSLLNPHVYLDAVVLVGGYSGQFGALKDRAAFAIGATAFSTLWFFGLSFVGGRLRAPLANPRAFKIVSWLSGVALMALAAKLGLDVWSWVVRAA